MKPHIRTVSVLVAAVFAATAVLTFIAMAVFRTTEHTAADTHYTLRSNANEMQYAAGNPADYSFSIVNAQGNTLKDFATVHTKQMHLVVVRKDLAFFQHLHPVFDAATGVFSLHDLTFPENGEYRVYADFAAGATSPNGTPTPLTLWEDVRVGTTYSPAAIGAEERSGSFDGYDVALRMHDNFTLRSGSESMLMFALSQHGKPVTDLEEYLGALGHTIIIKEGTMDFIHAHPAEHGAKVGDTVDFLVSFPGPGTYVAFTQFLRDGHIITSRFVLNVADGTGDTNERDTAHEMEHHE